MTTLIKEVVHRLRKLMLHLTTTFPVSMPVAVKTHSTVDNPINNACLVPTFVGGQTTLWPTLTNFCVGRGLGGPYSSVPMRHFRR